MIRYRLTKSMDMNVLFLWKKNQTLVFYKPKIIRF